MITASTLSPSLKTENHRTALHKLGDKMKISKPFTIILRKERIPFSIYLADSHLWHKKWKLNKIKRFAIFGKWMSVTKLYVRTGQVVISFQVNFSLETLMSICNFFRGKSKAIKYSHPLESSDLTIRSVRRLFICFYRRMKMFHFYISSVGYRFQLNYLIDTVRKIK